MLGDVARGVGFDQDVEVAGLVVAGDGGVGADDLFLDDFAGGAGAGESGGEGDVLADGEAEDGGWGWEGEAVAVRGGQWVVSWSWGRWRGGTYMATLWEMMVFSLSSKSWKTSGLRTGFSST